MPTTARAVPTIVAIGLAAALTACGGSDATSVSETDDGPPSAAPSTAVGGATESSFPRSFESCGNEFTVDSPPERAVFLGANDVTLVGAVGALDRFVAKAGDFPTDLYDEDTQDAVQAIPEFGAGQEADGSGTVQVSLEEVLDLDPDLVIGYEPEGSGITTDSLAQAGIPLLIIPSFCPDPADIPQSPGFDDIYQRTEFYGQLFDTDAAKSAVVALRDRVEAVADAAPETAGRTAATLFAYADTTPPSAYGSRSASHAVLETAGFVDVFNDVDERVFDPNFEEVIDRNPDVIVLLYSGGDPERVRESFVSLPGADQITAVRNNDILVQDFDLFGAPTPLLVDGLENVTEAFGSQ